MKKLVFCLFMIGVILNLCACTNSNSDDHVTKQEYDFQNDINEFRSNISAISFTYDEKTKTFNYLSNKTLITIENEKIEVEDDYIKLPFRAKYGNLSTDGNVFLEIKEDRSGILLSFDDYYSTWDEVLDYFTKNEIRATWFCKGGSVTDFMINAQNAGQCIGYHGKNHTMLQYFSPEKYDDYLDKFDWECIHFLPTFIGSGIRMYSFAIPHGSGLWFDWQMERLQKKYQIVRDFDPDFHLYTREEIEGGYISSQSIDNNKFISDEDFELKLRERFLITKMTKKIYPCTSHTFGTTTDVGDGYSITYKRLEILFKLIRQFDLKTYTFNDFCNEYN